MKRNFEDDEKVPLERPPKIPKGGASPTVGPMGPAPLPDIWEKSGLPRPERLPEGWEDTPSIGHPLGEDIKFIPCKVMLGRRWDGLVPPEIMWTPMSAIEFCYFEYKINVRLVVDLTFVRGTEGGGQRTRRVLRGEVVVVELGAGVA